MKRNGTMAPHDLEIPAWQHAAQEIIKTWRACGGQCSTWWGTLDDKHIPETIQNKGADYKKPAWWPEDIDLHIPWFTLWEYCYVLTQAELFETKELNLLSLGGAASALDLTCLLLGHRLTVLDARTYGVERQMENAIKLGCSSRLTVHPGMRIERLGELTEVYDGMISSNVIFLAGEPAQAACRYDLSTKIDPGGFACFTVDIANPNPLRFVDPTSVERRFSWNGFAREGDGWSDNGLRYHVYYPDPTKPRYTAGGLFLRRLP